MVLQFNWIELWGNPPLAIFCIWIKSRYFKSQMNSPHLYADFLVSFAEQRG